MIKKILTYCILLNFALILSPRTLWHNHNDSAPPNQHHKDHKKVPSHQHDDCYLCTFSLQPALTPVTINFNFPRPDNFVAVTVTSSFHSLEGKIFFSLRAPPSDTNLG